MCRGGRPHPHRRHQQECAKKKPIQTNLATKSRFLPHNCPVAIARHEPLVETRWRRIARVRLPQATPTLTTRGKSNMDASTRPGQAWAQGKRPDVPQRAWRLTAPKNSQQPPRPVQYKVEERFLLSRLSCWSCWHVCIPIKFRFVGWRPTCLVCDRRPTCRHHTFSFFCLPSSLPLSPCVDKFALLCPHIFVACCSSFCCGRCSLNSCTFLRASSRTC